MGEKWFKVVRVNYSIANIFPLEDQQKFGLSRTILALTYILCLLLTVRSQF